MASPAQAQMDGKPQIVYQQAAPQQIDPRLAARGVAPGGTYQDEKYCGPISLLIGFLAFPCICCCPCDERTAYTEPGTGRKVYLKN
mmetsp:Transcript_2173/g.3201  ORF Transcript_2173/g.3201 Transcript_2173/m.3201 type:complete len:86 (+) Transcript_2173:673-930(+)